MCPYIPRVYVYAFSCSLSLLYERLQNYVSAPFNEAVVLHPVTHSDVYIRIGPKLPRIHAYIYNHVPTYDVYIRDAQLSHSNRHVYIHLQHPMCIYANILIRALTLTSCICINPTFPPTYIHTYIYNNHMYICYQEPKRDFLALLPGADGGAATISISLLGVITDTVLAPRVAPLPTIGDFSALPIG